MSNPKITNFYMRKDLMRYINEYLYSDYTYCEIVREVFLSNKFQRTAFANVVIRFIQNRYLGEIETFGTVDESWLFDQLYQVFLANISGLPEDKKTQVFPAYCNIRNQRKYRIPQTYDVYDILEDAVEIVRVVAKDVCKYAESVLVDAVLNSKIDSIDDILLIKCPLFNRQVKNTFFQCQNDSLARDSLNNRIEKMDWILEKSKVYAQ